MTGSPLARIAVLAVLLVAALVAAGCGNKHSEVTEGETEGIWVDVGLLDYHVQGSRVLSEGVEPDRAYLNGLPEGVGPAAGDEVWFGVFLRVENNGDETAPSARDFEIVDTEGRSYRPFGLDPRANPFAYQPAVLDPNRELPVPDSAADLNSFSGNQLLFKIPLESYQNRPLQFVIHSPGGDGPEEAHVNLDV